MAALPGLVFPQGPVAIPWRGSANRDDAAVALGAPCARVEEERLVPCAVGPVFHELMWPGPP